MKKCCAVLIGLALLPGCSRESNKAESTALGHGTNEIWNGTRTIKHQTLDELEVTGVAHLTHVKIKGDLKVSVVATLHHVDVLGRTDVTGTLDADHVKLKDLVVAAEEFTLSHANVQNVTVRLNQPHKPQTVHLKNHSVVHGEVVFDAGDGSVMLHEGSQVKGQIVGGKIAK